MDKGLLALNMKIEIISVVKKEFEEVMTNQIKPNVYWRLGPDRWKIRLGTGWEDHHFCEAIEEAYQVWQKKSKE